MDGATTGGTRRRRLGLLPVAPARSLPRRAGRGRRLAGEGALRRRHLPAAQIAVLAAAGVVLNVLIMLVALLMVRDATSVDHATGQVVEAQRAFQDADMMHDALNADVLAAVAVAAGAVPRSLEREHQGQAQRHARQYLDDLDRVAALALPPQDAEAVRDLRPQQSAYHDLAVRLTREPLSLEVLQAQLPEFRDRFTELERQQEVVTDRLAALSAASRGRGRAVRAGPRRSTPPPRSALWSASWSWRRG